MRTKLSYSKSTFLKKIALISTTLIYPLSSDQSYCQEAPYDNRDSNGVDLTDGSFDFKIVDGSIGAGETTLSSTTRASGGYNWATQYLTINRAGGVATIGVYTGGTVDTFVGATSRFTSLRAGRARLIQLPGNEYEYSMPDGSTILFKNPVTTPPGGTSNLCDHNNITNCSLLAYRFTSTNGLAIDLEYDISARCTGTAPTQNCIYARRVSKVTNGFFSISLSYVNNSVPAGQSPSQDWFRRSSSEFKNLLQPSAPTLIATYGYPSATVRTVTTPGGKVWRFTDNSAGRLVGIKRPEASADSTTIAYGANGVTSITNDGISTSYNRTLSGNTATMVVTNAKGGKKTVISDMVLYRPTSIEDENGNTTQFTYYTDGLPSTITLPDESQIVYGYDGRRNTISTTLKPKPLSGLADTVLTAEFPYPCTIAGSCDKPSVTRDAYSNQTEYAYNSLGQLTKVTYPAPAAGQPRPQKRYTYGTVSGISMLVSVSECQTLSSCDATSDEVKTTITYDANFLVPSIVTTAAGDGNVTATVTTTYDAVGNIATVDGSLPGTADTTSYRWSADRELVGLISPDPDGAGAMKRRAVRTAYNFDGQVRLIETGTVQGTTDTDWALFTPLQRLEMQYVNGRLTRETTASGGTAYQIASYSYDSAGRLECVAQRMWWASVPYSACDLSSPISGYGPDRITKFDYDVGGRVVKSTSGFATPGATEEQRITYNTGGSPLTIIDAKNNVTTFAYDGFGRLARTYFPSSTTSGVSSTTDFEELTYDKRDLITSRLLRGHLVDPTKKIEYTYDLLARLTKQSTSGETDIFYQYDLLNRLIGSAQGAHSLTNSYDALGRLASAGGPQGAMTYQHDAGGRRTRSTWPGSPSFFVEYTYLVTGEMKEIKENGADSGLARLALFSYDDLGRRTSLLRGNNQLTTYSYDPISRLNRLSNDLSGVSFDINQTFNYNPANQIVSTTKSNDVYAWTDNVSGTTNYSVNGLNQLVSAGDRSFAYDARGNVIKDYVSSTPTAGKEYVYNTYNSLTTVRTTSTTPTTLATFAYDPLLRLYGLGAGAVSRRLQYDGADVVAEYDTSGTRVARYVHGPGVDEPLVWYRADGIRRWFHADERGSIIASSDDLGNKQAVNTYDEYGVPSSTNYSSRYQYTGQLWISEAGLYYYRARLYDPRVGRFIQPDPLGYSDGMNLYSYTRNDPVNRSDPTGFSSGIIVLTGGCAQAGGINFGSRCFSNDFALSLIFGQRPTIDIPNVSLPGSSVGATSPVVQCKINSISLFKFGKTIDISGNIAFPSGGQEYLSDINKAWTGNFGSYNVTNNMQEGLGGLVVNLSYNSGFRETASIGGPNINLRAQSVIPPHELARARWTAGHEFGHSMKLQDMYRDVTTMNSSGVNVTVSVPNPGYAGEIMAQVGGKPREDTINKILANCR